MIAASEARSQAPSARWLLFIHQLPPKPDYLRVRVRRRLRRLGAVAMKNTVYLLPNSAESLEDFQWLRAEIEGDGGTALIAEASFVEGISDEEVEGLLAAEGSTETGDPEAEPRAADHVEPGRTWVTREDVFVDRIASAWLIRRFIDPDARFRFVPAKGYAPKRGELRFDMVGGEYTHVGSDCTFQTLVRRFSLEDPALSAIGEIVHDIDCKDDRFHRAEAPGVTGMLRGIAVTSRDDAERLDRGGRVFDDLYTFFQAGA